jgi:hypothetical protein
MSAHGAAFHARALSYAAWSSAFFFQHDGRATPQNGGLLAAIQAHASQGSEASSVISSFNHLGESQKQDLLNFLRSL